MGKTKIYEIAKEIGLASKEVVAKAQSLGMSVTSHMSSVDDEQANKIRESFGQKGKEAKEAKVADKPAKKEKANKPKEKEATPVIIRIEFIFNEE